MGMDLETRRTMLYNGKHLETRCVFDQQVCTAAAQMQGEMTRAQLVVLLHQHFDGPVASPLLPLLPWQRK